MALQKGICKNFGECDLADNKEIQEVEKSNFVCEECGKPLHPVDKKVGGDPPKINKKLIAIICGAVAAVGAIAGGIFAFIGGGEEAPKSITLNHTTKTLIVGETDTLSATILPEGIEAQLEWIADNDRNITVADGIVTAVAEGNAEVQVRVKGVTEPTAVCSYKVEPKQPEPTIIQSIEFSDKALSLKEGENKQVTPSIQPEQNDETVSFASSDESVATVSEDGTITAKKKGTAKITAKTSKTELTATIEVKVTKETSGSLQSFNLGWGLYEGPMSGGVPNGIGGEVKVTRAYSLDLKKSPAEYVELNSGDKIVNTKFVNGKLRQGEIQFADGSRRWINL